MKSRQLKLLIEDEKFEIKKDLPDEKRAREVERKMFIVNWDK